MAEQKTIAELIRIEGIDCKGFGIISKFVMTDADLDSGAKALYAYFCSYAGNGTTAFPGRDRIISSLNICKTSYYSYLTQLIDNGYIRVERGNIYPFGNTYYLIARPAKLENVKSEDIKSSDKLIVKGLKAFGYGTVPKTVMIDNRLHIKAKALYAYFCSFSGNGSTAFPKRSDILHHLKISINPFQKYIQQLIACNYIDVEQQKKNGKFAGNIYYLNDMPSEEAGLLALEERAAMQHKKTGQAADAPVDDDYCVPEEKEDTESIDTAAVCEQAPAQELPQASVNETKALDMAEQRQVYNEIIKENIEYDILISRQNESSFVALVDNVCEIMLDVITSTTPTVRINSQEKPTEVVKSKFLKLKYENIEYAIDSLLNATTLIKNKRQYIITVLYNSDQVDFHWTNHVKHDFG